MNFGASVSPIVANSATGANAVMSDAFSITRVPDMVLTFSTRTIEERGFKVRFNSLIFVCASTGTIKPPCSLVPSFKFPAAFCTSICFAALISASFSAPRRLRRSCASTCVVSTSSGAGSCLPCAAGGGATDKSCTSCNRSNSRFNPRNSSVTASASSRRFSLSKS